MKKSVKFSAEVIERAVRMVFEAKDQYQSQWAAIVSTAAKIGCTAETLRRWVRQHERDNGQREGTTTAEAKRRIFRLGGLAHRLLLHPSSSWIQLKECCHEWKLSQVAARPLVLLKSSSCI